MSEKLNDSKIEEVAGGYEAPAAQTDNETEPGGGIMALMLVSVTIAVNPAAVVQPQYMVAPMALPLVNANVTVSPMDPLSDPTDKK